MNQGLDYISKLTHWFESIKLQVQLQLIPKIR